jgi:cell division protein FtsA
MAYTNFIAAIDLGTSHIAGMIATKNASGAITILAYETASSASCIRRGCIYNMDEAAYLIKGLIQKLHNKIAGDRIEKVYVGIGGQSIHAINHVVTKSLGNETSVTTDIIKAMDAECRNYHPEMLDVLDIVSPTYYLNDKKEINPVGISCSRIEAHYKLIVGRPSLRRDIYGSIKEKANVNIAGVFVSPLALADAVLSQGEKDLGCALINFGAGVTSVSIYKYGNLSNLWVIPLGGNLITKDIMTLNIVEHEAERIKKTYGSLIIDKDDDSSIPVNAAEGRASPAQGKRALYGN